MVSFALLCDSVKMVNGECVSSGIRHYVLSHLLLFNNIKKYVCVCVFYCKKPATVLANDVFLPFEGLNYIKNTLIIAMKTVVFKCNLAITYTCISKCKSTPNFAMIQLANFNRCV